MLGERFEECQQHQADHKQLAWRVAPIHGVPEAVAFGDKHRWIVGMVVQEASSNPVPISIAELVVSTKSEQVLGRRGNNRREG
jgi:hypothetical protein